MLVLFTTSGTAQTKAQRSGDAGSAGSPMVLRTHHYAGGDVVQTTTAERPRVGEWPLSFASWAAIAGGLLMLVLGIPLAPYQQSDSSAFRTILGLNAVQHLLLIGAVAGLARAGAAGRGRLGRAGFALALLGLAVLTLAELAAMVDTGTAEPLYASATLTIALGLILAGVAVLRAGRWIGWQRLIPLACGLYVPLVMLPLFALPGYASNFAIGGWGVCWLFLGLALRRADATSGSPMAESVVVRGESVMRRFIVLTLVLAGLLGGARVADSLAQEGTPPADAFAQPVGVTFDGLALGLIEALPSGQTGLGLFRTTLEPGAGTDLPPDPSYYLIYVEFGAVTFRVDAPARVSRVVDGTPAAQALGPAAAAEIAAGTDVMLEQGDAATFDPTTTGVPGEVRNDGQAPAVALVVSAGPAEESVPATGTPVP